MEYRTLGGSGLRVSELGLGTNNFGGKLDRDGVAAVLDAAIDLGVNLLDTADVYSAGRSEELIGEVLGGRRQQVLIATKLGHPMGEGHLQRGSSRRWIMTEVENSLRRLKTDYIDLYQLHTPDPETPIAESLGALDDLVRAGKVRYHGHSNFAGWQIADADWTARTGGLSRPVSAQNRYNLLDRGLDQEVLPAVRRFGVGLIPFVPLASGFLTGKYRSGSTPEGSRLSNHPAAARLLTEANFKRLEALEAFAAERERSIADLALGWLLSKPEVATIIPSAASPEQLKANYASSLWRLTPDEMAAVEKL